MAWDRLGTPDLYVCVFLHASVTLYTMCISVCASVCLSILSDLLAVHRFYPSVQLSNYPSSCLSVRLSFCVYRFRLPYRSYHKLLIAICLVLLLIATDMKWEADETKADGEEHSRGFSKYANDLCSRSIPPGVHSP